MARYHPNPPNGAIYDQDDLDRLRDYAIKVERERCAKIAENWHPILYAPECGGSHPIDSAYTTAKVEIAKLIRKSE